MRRPACALVVACSLAAIVACSSGEQSASSPAPRVLEAADCPDPASNDLSGLWESRETSKGGIGQAIEFRADGINVESTAVIVNMYFRLDGDLLSSGLTPEVSDNSSRIRVAGNSLVETGTDGSIITMTRFGDVPSDSSQVVGMWRYRHYAGPLAFTWFTEDGRLLFRMPMRSSANCYAVDGKDLTISNAKGEKTVLQFEVRDGEMSLGKAGHPARTYVRTPAAWYDIQHLDIGPPHESLRKATEQMKRKT